MTNRVPMTQEAYDKLAAEIENINESLLKMSLLMNVSVFDFVEEGE